MLVVVEYSIDMTQDNHKLMDESYFHILEEDGSSCYQLHTLNWLDPPSQIQNYTGKSQHSGMCRVGDQQFVEH